MTEFRNIILIGAGNVATQLGKAILNSGRKISQVYSRTDASARLLADKLNAGFAMSVGDVQPGAGLYIIAVSDDAIPEVAGKLRTGNKMVVHCSGSVPMEILNECSENIGVLYPLQTFSRTREIDFKTIPLCLESNKPENLQKLKTLAEDLSEKVAEINSEERKVLHLAAVFACNFPNFMYQAAENILHGSNLDFDLLRPLILETARKVQEMNPAEAQTGPAFRGDKRIINEHLEMLKDLPELQKIYRMMSEEIRKRAE